MVSEVYFDMNAKLKKEDTGIMDSIEFFLPDFYSRCRLILLVHDMMDKYPDYFFERAKITAAYGCFPGSIWNGGRIMLGSCTKQEIQYVQNELNSRGIALRFTFTNPLIEEKHLQDTFCNLCLQLTDNGMNEILVNSPVLEKYIRSNYPSFPLISSTTICLRSADAITEELEKDYRLVVLDSAFNNTPSLFEMPHKDKIELLVNHYCQDDCPRREAHYREVGKCQLEFSETDFESCRFIKRDFYQIMKNSSFITVEDIFGRYSDAGFCHFKLDGRAFNKYKVIESFVYFLARPECRDEVRLAILKSIDKL